MLLCLLNLWFSINTQFSNHTIEYLVSSYNISDWSGNTPIEGDFRFPIALNQICKDCATSIEIFWPENLSYRWKPEKHERWLWWKVGLIWEELFVINPMRFSVWIVRQWLVLTVYFKSFSKEERTVDDFFKCIHLQNRWSGVWTQFASHKDILSLNRWH